MKSSSWKDYAEIIGIVAIVASLIFVGLQMKQSHQIALSAIYQARSDSSMAIRMAPLESETLLSARTKQRHGEGDTLTPEERTALRSLLVGQITYLENVHYQYISGFISEEHWQTNREEIEGILRREPGLRESMIGDCRVFRESFCAEWQRAVEVVEADLQ